MAHSSTITRRSGRQVHRLHRSGNHYAPVLRNYVEGTYVGYKFYETAADEGLINYDDTVIYPFGYA